MASSCGGRSAKRAAAATDPAAGTVPQETVNIRIADSLHVVDGAGPVVTDYYAAVLPGLDSPGISYELTLMHYETAGSGVYELSTANLETVDGISETHTTRGRYSTLTGMAGNKDAAYISLVPFGKSVPESRFAVRANGLTLLGEDLTVPGSETDYTLVKKHAGQ
jgi:hypothetical protein